jgi:hypothetical protein
MRLLSLPHSHFALSRRERVRYELDFYSNNQKGGRAVTSVDQL